MKGITALCNKALAHLGKSTGISELDSERSSEASACRQFYEDVRDMVLRDYPWPFAERIVALALVEESPNSEWGYSYRYPSDCLSARRILSGVRNDTMDTVVKKKLGQDSEGRLIFTDKEDAELEYTCREKDTSKYPPDFQLAVSLLLAHFIAPMLTRGDKERLGDKAYQRYLLIVGRARANAANEETSDSQPDSELIRGRE